MIRRVARNAGSARIAFASSSPFMPGIFMSISATSYGARRAAASRSIVSARSPRSAASLTMPQALT